MNKYKVSYVAGGLLLIAVALLYLFTLDNGLRPDELTGGDLITHQYAQVQARPSNAPGYPLYTMGGWLWFRLGRLMPFGFLNPVQILSFYSALWGLASLAILYLILLEICRGRWPVALLLTAFYATTFFFWYYSVTTEQYTSAVFQTLLIIGLAFWWDNDPRDSLLRWMALVSGTMLANMVTTLLILPPLLWFVGFRKVGDDLALVHYLKRPGLVMQTVGLTLLPLVSYLFIYIRGAQHPEWRGAGDWPTTWAWFVDFITIRQGRDEFAPGLSLQTVFTDEFPALMGQELTWILFFGGLVGLAFLGRRRAVFLGSTLMLYFVFSWGYRFGNWFQVIIPAYPIFIIGFAAGVTRLSEWATNRFSSKQTVAASEPDQALLRPAAGFRATIQPHRLINWAILLLVAGLLLYRFSISLPQANQRNLAADTGLDPGWSILADKPVTPALISGSFEERVALQYLSAVWGVGPDIIPSDAHSSEILERPGPSHTVYISRQAANINPTAVQQSHIYPQAWGQQLIGLREEPLRQVPATAHPVKLVFGDHLQLVGWEEGRESNVSRTSGGPPASAGWWRLTLYWQTPTRLAHDYTVSVRPLVEGQPIMADEEPLIQDHQPVWGVYPTSRWRPQELVRDVYALPLPPDLNPTSVQIVVYRATETGFENLAEQSLDLR